MREDLGEYEDVIQQKKSKKMFDEDVPDLCDDITIEGKPAKKEKTPPQRDMLKDAEEREYHEAHPYRYPREVYKPDWGAFLLTPLWALANNVLIGLLWFVPYLGFFISLLLLFKGGEWAWQRRRFKDVDEFTAVRKAWTIAGLVFHGLWILGLIILFIIAWFTADSGTPPRGHIS